MKGKCPNSPFNEGGACQNSSFNEIILATTICGEDDFLFIKVLTHLLLVYESFDTPSSYLLLVRTFLFVYYIFRLSGSICL